MIEAISGFINGMAQVIGYVVMSIVGLLFVLKLYSYRLWSQSSEEAKQVGAMMQKESGWDSGITAMLTDEIFDSIDDMLPDSHLDYEPRPVGTIDWSIDKPPESERRQQIEALEEAGYYVRPFPREDEGEWSTGNAGIWAEPPTWYLHEDPADDKEQRRVEVSPDFPSQFTP